MKARFFTTLMTSAALLAGTLANAQQKNMDAAKFSDKKKDRMKSVTLCLYGSHDPATYYQSLQTMDRFDMMARENNDMAYLPVGNGVAPIILDSVKNRTMMAKRSFPNSNALNIVLDFDGSILASEKNDTVFATNRVYRNNIMKKDSAALNATDLFGAIAAGLVDKTNSHMPNINLLILSRTGAADLHAIGNTMPPGTIGVILNAARNPLFPGKSNMDYARAAYQIRDPDAFLESEIQLSDVNGGTKPLPEDRDVIAFYVADEPGSDDTAPGFETKYKVYAFSLRDAMKSYPQNLDSLTFYPSGFMDDNVRNSFERYLRKDIRKGVAPLESYLEKTGMAFIFEAMRQGENYRSFNQTAGDIHRTKLTIPKSSLSPTPN